MDTGGMKSNAKIIGIAVGAVLGFIFILQNFEQTSFQFLVWTLFSGPKWIVMSCIFGGGLGLGYVMGKKKSR